MKHRAKNISLILSWLAIFLVYPAWAEVSNATDSLTLILASPDDAYYSLVQEIGAACSLLVFVLIRYFPLSNQPGLERSHDQI